MAVNNDDELNSENRDQVILHSIKQHRKITHANSHIGESSANTRIISYWSDNRKKNQRGYTYWTEFKPSLLTNDKISMVMAPSWGTIFPPYGIARLTGLLRHYGYNVVVHDINVKSYKYLLEKYNVDFWESNNYFKWEQPIYGKEVHPILKPILDDYVQNILDDNSNFIGFSVYLTNLLPTLYMIQRIKELSPGKVIIVGGPEAFNTWFDELVHVTHKLPRGMIDFCIKGEGEQELLTLLENYNTIPKSDNMIELGGLKSSLDLNSLPFPDYDDYNLDDYEYPDGASIETSRGCVAKCTFCAETHFWRFRWRESNRVADEMEYQVKKYGITRFWFVDSLANGHLNEFKKLIAEIIDRKLNVRWNSYARCDGRMDAALFNDIAKSGCTTLSFGVESGSERVLAAMKKNIKVWEIENNLRDSTVAGIHNHVNWVVGFPTETATDWLHSLHVLHNTRNWIYAISPGMTCGDAAFSDLNLNWKAYGLQWTKAPWDNTFMSNWYTAEYKNTIIHRFIRLKFMNIWLRIMQDHAGATLINGQNRKTIKNFYTFKFDTAVTPLEYLPQEHTQQFEYFKAADTDPLPLKLSVNLANEYAILPWIFYKIYGAFEFTMISDPDMDLQEFGGFIASPYYSEFKCSADARGNLKFHMKQKFVHATTRGDNRVKHDECVKQDMSFDWQEYAFTCNIADFNTAQPDSDNSKQISE
jgi:hypothetical protein